MYSTPALFAVKGELNCSDSMPWISSIEAYTCLACVGKIFANCKIKPAKWQMGAEVALAHLMEQNAQIAMAKMAQLAICQSWILTCPTCRKPQMKEICVMDYP